MHSRLVPAPFLLDGFGLILRPGVGRPGFGSGEVRLAVRSRFLEGSS